MAIEELNNYKKSRYSNVDMINNVMKKRKFVEFIFRNNNSHAFDYCKYTFHRL